ncbi:MAG: hypothetical protein U1E37_08890 [Sphingomonadaceae bacterium]
MIQSPALSPLSMVPAAGDLPLPAAPEGAELADFGALLALSANQAATGPAADASAQPGTTGGNEPATPGKELPLALPVAVPVLEPEKLSPKPKVNVVGDLPLAKAVLPVMPHPGKARGKDLPEPEAQPSGDEAAQIPVAEAPAKMLPLPIALPVPAAAAPPRQPAEASGEVPIRSTRTPQAIFLSPKGPRPDQSASAPAQPVQPQAASAAPPAQVRIELVPAAPVMRALAKDDLRPAPLPAAPEVQALPAVGTAPLAAPTPLHPMAAAPVTGDRPQDFSALIDRLVAAREAVAPQTVAISIPHAEFGQVHLRFRHEEAGLAVSMASADPAFARAASAAPPVLPVAEAQVAQFQAGQSAPRQDGSAASGQSTTGQQRQSQAERRDDQPHANNAPRSARADKAQQRAGIFA